MGEPLAYFLTIRPYGSWLPGQEGWIDRRHNQFNTPALPADPRLEEAVRLEMADDPFTLEAGHRKVVKGGVLEVCNHCGWQPHAIHVRTTHVHIILSGNVGPEAMMKRLKAICTQRLHEAGLQRKKVWSRHGSNPYLWDEESLHAAIEYVLYGQGESMEIWPEPARTPGPMAHQNRRRKPACGSV